ncbi:MAG: GNAT family N-acetyltransferase [Proteobacteria bacterium]|nr:GNAT family N-acetyltransferase [Pseudomonadota bacterium]
MFIETARLVLREPLKEDAVILGYLWLNEIVRAFLGGTIENEQVLEKINNLLLHWQRYKFGLWVICEKGTHEVTGLCGPHYSNDGIEISYMFFAKFWGKGFATEAVKTTIDYCFDKLNIESLIAITQKANIKSCSLLEKLRLRHIKDFDRYNAVQSLYKITKKEWEVYKNEKLNNDY